MIFMIGRSGQPSLWLHLKADKGITDFSMPFIHNYLFKVEGFSISGIVRKSAGKDPVVGAKVVLDKTRSATTDTEGRYTFQNVQSGKHKIRVTTGKII